MCSYLSAVTEFLTGRDIDTCPGDTSAGEEGYSTGQALNNMGIARMDIYDSEVACETAPRPPTRIVRVLLHQTI